MNYNSVKNQEIKGKFVGREVYANVGTLVEYILQKSYEDNNTPFGMDDLTNYYLDNSGKIEELQEKIDIIQEELDELEDKKEEEIEESQDLLDDEQISQFTHDANLINIDEKYSKLHADLEKEIEDLEEEIRELEQEQEEPQEPYEWWMVSGWLCQKLKEKGQVVLEDENIWGRCTSGQAILLDSVISEICHDLEILEGQKNEWK